MSAPTDLVFTGCVCTDATHRNPDRLAWAPTLAQAKAEAQPAWMAGALVHFIQRETKKVAM